MLKEIWASFRVLWNNGADTAKNADHIKNVEDELSQLSELVQILAVRDAQHERELTHQRELHQKELENVELRLRLELSEKLRQLPPRSE